MNNYRAEEFAEELKFAVGTWMFGALGDRFVADGYQVSRPLTEKLDIIAALPDVTGVELVYPGDIDENNVVAVARELQQRGLEAAMLCVDVYTHKKWRFGAVTSGEARLYEEALQIAAGAAGVAEKLGCPPLNLWMGQDGHDYPFQQNYARVWEQLINYLQKAAGDFPKARFCLEYKQKEPRTHSLIPTTYAALLAVEEAGLPNLGITLDVGHVLMSGENMAGAAALLMHKNRLFHLHFNDNYRSWDDDMAVGSVHTVEFVELLYWLRKGGYSGWYSLDLYPYREDAARACRYSVKMIKRLHRVAAELYASGFDESIKQDNVLDVLETVMDKLLK